jgi:hypothetical protein
VWRSKTSICTSSRGRAAWLVAAVAIAAAGLAACTPRDAAVAKLEKATGAVTRQAKGEPDRKPAQVGTSYFLGDSAHAMNGTGTLGIAGGPAKIVMRDGATLRFSGQRGKLQISVESGVVDLQGAGSYSLDIADVTLTGESNLEITSTGSGGATLKLRRGAGTVAANGDTMDLPINVQIEVAPNTRLPRDAGVPDAPAAPVDAAVAATDDAAPAVGDAFIEVTGRRAELLAPGQTAWKPLPAGAGRLAPGSAVRLGPATTAKLTAGTTAVDLASGARVQLGDGPGNELGVRLDAGGARVVATAPASLALPGGAVALAADSAAAETRLEAGPRDTRVTMLRGGSRLTGGPGAELAMNRGETALLTRAGAIRVVEAIPGFFDFRVKAGEAFTIHDPKPPTAVQFQFEGKCPDGGVIELDRDNRFRTAKVSGGREFAHMMLAGGAWAYRLRCTRNGVDGPPVASGRVTVVRDDGRRPLPKVQGVNDIDADGRNYRISYQSAIPNVVVHVRNPGAVHRLHLAVAGKEQTFDSATPAITVPGNQLHEGSYTLWIDRDGVKQDKVSTLIIDFDQTAPQVYIEAPINAQPWPADGDIGVRGAVLPGWSAAVEDVPIPIDKQRRFSVTAGTPAGKALAIRLSHPQRGVHYYLRRPK